MPPKKAPPAITPVHSTGDKRKIQESPDGSQEHKLVRSEPPPFYGTPASLEDIRALLSPLQEEVSSLRSELGLLKSELVSTVSSIVEPPVVKHVQSSTTKLESEVCDIKSRLDKLSLRDEIDRCKLQALAYNVPAGVDRSRFLQFLNEVSPDSGISSFRLVADKDRSKGTSTCFISFSSGDSRNRFVSAFKQRVRKFSHGEKEHDITVKNCLPAAWRERNAAFRRKVDEVKLSLPTENHASVDWKARTISIRGKIAFRQKRDSLDFVEIK